MAKPWNKNSLGILLRHLPGKAEDERGVVVLLDYGNPLNNSFHVVNQWTFVEYSEKRPDLIVFVNGMPLVVFELKSPSREETDASDAYKQIRNYMKHIPSLFVPNAFCVMSDLAETRVGTISAKEDRYVAWKSVDGDYSGTTHADWKTMLDGMLEKHRLIDIVHNFICFNDSAESVVMILAGYHQYFAVRKAVERAEEAVAGDGKIGVFWHTQGSGKSLSMVFFAHLLRERIDSPTIVVITDRNDLDDQLYGQFGRCKAFLRQEPVKAGSRQHLKRLLVGREANGIVFTTMQKFMDGDDPLCDRSNVVVMVDEAHRGQYGLTERMDAQGNVFIGAARMVRKALPNASYIGFTGTPIVTEDKNTREIYCADGIGWITPRDLSNTTDKFIAHGTDDITQLGYDSCSVRMLPSGTVLFSSRAPIGYIAIATDNVTTNQGFKSVVPHEDIGTAFVYCFLKRNKNRIADDGSGTTFPEVSGKTMAGIELSLPDIELCAEFSEWAKPLLDQQRCLEEESRRLGELRDALLPKLMSGEIDVSEVEL